MGRYKLPPRLRFASLTMSGVKRLREAERNVHYLLMDCDNEVDELRHHADVTPIHEAGHAVAFTLGAATVRDVRYWPFGSHRGFLGECRLVERGAGGIPVKKYLRKRGRDNIIREIVSTFAGPMAEIRRNPSRAASGARGDLDVAEDMLKCVDQNGFGCRFALHEWAWREASRMMADDHVYAAVREIADRLSRSRSYPRCVSGGAVRTVVTRHLPTGWAWSMPPAAMSA